MTELKSCPPLARKLSLSLLLFPEQTTVNHCCDRCTDSVIVIFCSLQDRIDFKIVAGHFTVRIRQQLGDETARKPLLVFGCGNDAAKCVYVSIVSAISKS